MSLPAMSPVRGILKCPGGDSGWMDHRFDLNGYPA
jgi:hypothetical protein